MSNTIAFQFLGFKTLFLQPMQILDPIVCGVFISPSLNLCIKLMIWAIYACISINGSQEICYFIFLFHVC